MAELILTDITEQLVTRAQIQKELSYWMLIVPTCMKILGETPIEVSLRCISHLSLAHGFYYYFIEQERYRKLNNLGSAHRALNEVNCSLLFNL